MTVACLACRKDKKKCSGNEPCERCVLRQEACTYPVVSRLPRIKIGDLKRKLDKLETTFQTNNIFQNSHYQIKLKYWMANLSKTGACANFDSSKEPSSCPGMELISNPDQGIRTNVSQDLFNIYSNFIHPTFPVIDLGRIASNAKSSELLLTSIYFRSVRYLISVNKSEAIEDLTKVPFYAQANHLLATHTSVDLDSIQAELIIGIDELGQNMALKASRRASNALAKAKILQLHQNEGDIDEMSPDFMIPAQKHERRIAYIGCLYIDFMSALMTKTPNLSHERMAMGLGEPIDLDWLEPNTYALNSSPIPDLISDEYSEYSSKNSENPTSPAIVGQLAIFERFPRILVILKKVHMLAIESKNHNVTIQSSRASLLQYMNEAKRILPSYIKLNYLTSTSPTNSLLVLEFILYQLVYHVLIESSGQLLKMDHETKNPKENEEITNMLELCKTSILAYRHYQPNFWNDYATSSFMIAIPALMSMSGLKTYPDHPISREFFPLAAELVNRYVFMFPTLTYKLKGHEASFCGGGKK